MMMNVGSFFLCRDICSPLRRVTADPDRIRKGGVLHCALPQTG